MVAHDRPIYVLFQFDLTSSFGFDTIDVLNYFELFKLLLSQLYKSIINVSEIATPEIYKLAQGIELWNCKMSKMKTRVRKKSTSVAAAEMENDDVIESSDHIVVKRKKGKDKQLVK